MPRNTTKNTPNYSSDYKQLLNSDSTPGGLLSSANALSESVDKLNYNQQTESAPVQDPEQKGAALALDPVTGLDTNGKSSMSVTGDLGALIMKSPSDILNSDASTPKYNDANDSQFGTSWLQDQRRQSRIADIAYAIPDWASNPIKASKKMWDWTSGSAISAQNSFDSFWRGDAEGINYQNAIQAHSVNSLQDEITNTPNSKEYLDWLSSWQKDPARHVDKTYDALGPLSAIGSVIPMAEHYDQHKNDPTKQSPLLDNPISRGLGITSLLSGAKDLLTKALPSNDEEADKYKSRLNSELTPYERDVANRAQFPFILDGKKTNLANIPVVGDMALKELETGSNDLPGLSDVPKQFRAAHIALSGTLKNYLDAKRNFSNDGFIKSTATNAYHDWMEPIGTPNGSSATELPSIQDIATNINLPQFGKQAAFSSVNKQIQDKTQENNLKIAKYTDNINYRDKPSEYFEQKLSEGSNLYGLGDMAGAMASMVGAQVGTIAANAALNFGATLLAPEEEIPASIINGLTTGVNLASNAYQRVKMDNLEVANYSVQKINKYLLDNKLGSPISDRSDSELLSKINDNGQSNIVDKAKEEYDKTGAITPGTKYALASAINTGSVGFNDDGFKRAYKNSTSGLDELKARDFVYSLGGYIQTALAVTPGGAFIKSTLGNAIEKSAGKELFDEAGNIVQDAQMPIASLSKINAARQLYTNSAIKMLQNKVAPYVSIAQMTAADATLQYLEQAGKYVNGTNYVNNNTTNNSSVIGSLIDGYAAPIGGIATAAGITNDNRYINRNNLNDAGIGGVVMSLAMPLLGGIKNIPHTLIDNARARSAKEFVDSNVDFSNKNTTSDKPLQSNISTDFNNGQLSKNNSFVAGVAGDNIDSDMRIEKSKIYVSAATKDKAAHVLKYMEELVKNPPEGYTSKDISDELEIAKETLSTANDKNVLRYVKKTGAYGSDDHKLLTGLIMDHRRSLELSENEVENQKANYQQLESKEYSNNIGYGDYLDNLKIDKSENSEKDAVFSTIDDFTKKKIFSLSNRADIIRQLIEDKSANDSNEKENGGTGYASTKNVLYGRGLVSDLVNTSSELHSLLKENDLSLDEIKDAPITSVSDEYKTAVAKHIAAKAGTLYDTLMQGKFLGYDLKYKKDGSSSYIRMSSDAHDKFVSEKLDDYRDSRAAESADSTVANQKEESLNSFKDNHDIASTFAVSSPGTKVQTVQSEYILGNKTSEPIVPEEQVKPTEPIKQDSVPTEDSSIDNLKNTIPPVDETKPKSVPDIPLGEPNERESAFENENTPITPSIESVSTEDSSDIPLISDEYIPDINEKDAVDAENAMNNLKLAHPDDIQDITIAGSNSSSEATKEESVKVQIDQADPSKSAFRASRLFFGEFSDSAAKSFKSLSKDKKGFRSAKQLGDMLNSKDALSGCTFEIHVGGDDNNIFTPGHDTTYPLAKIFVKITKAGGPHEGEYLALVRDPLAPVRVGESSPTSSDIEELNTLRRNIIDLYILPVNRMSDTPRKLVATSITLVNGINATIKEEEIRTNEDGSTYSIHKQRNIDEIPGFGIQKIDGKTDWSLVSSKSTRLRIGMGVDGFNELMDAYGTRIGRETMESNTGNVYLMVDGNGDGKERPVHVNLKQFSREDSSVIDFVNKLLPGFRDNNVKGIIGDENGNPIKGGKEVETGISPEYMLEKLINFGQKTIVSEERAKDKGFLLSKQFYIDENSSSLVIGGNSILFDEVPTEKGVSAIKEFIKNNLHWTLDKTHLVDDNNNDIRVSELFPSLNKLFNDETRDIKSVYFAKDLSITKDDMNLTWTAWMMKNGKILSDATDDIFTPPFMHLGEFKMVNEDSIPFVLTNGGKFVREAENGKLDVSSGEIQTQIDNKTKEVDALLHLAETQPNESILNALGEATSELTELNSKYAEKVETFSESLDSTPINPESEKIENTPTFDDLDGIPMEDPDEVAPSANSLLKDKINRTINVAVESKWLTDKLGLKEDEIEVLDHILTTANDKQAMGMMLQDSIRLWKGAEEGTAYHEAFHRVSLLMFSRAERLRTYNKVREEVPSMKNATNKGIEEYLAEGFRKYKLAGTEPKDSFYINRFFRRIVNFTKKLLNLSPSSLDRLYKDIDLGVFKGHKINENSLREFKSEYGESADYGIKELGLKTISTYSQLFSVRDGLMYYLFKLNGVNGIDKNVKDINFDRLKATIKASADSAPEGEKKEVFSEIYDKFDTVFKPKMISSLSDMGIREIDKHNETDSSSNQIADEASAHMKASYEISKKDNIRTGVKMFIATMPHSILENNSIKPVIDPLTGFKKFIPFSESWNTMISHLSNESTVEGMMGKIQRLSENNAFYKNLIGRLNETYSNGKPILSEDFKTQFWNTMFSMRHEFINIGYKEKLQSADQISSLFTVMDSDVDTATKTLPAAWGQMFSMDDNIFTPDKDGNRTFNKEYVKSLVDRFRTGIANPNNWEKNGIDITNSTGRSAVINEITGLYNKVGINIDNETIEYLLSDNKYGPEESINTLKDYLLSTKSGKMSILFNNVLSTLIKNEGSVFKKNRYTGASIENSVKNIFLGESFSKTLAAAYVKVHPSPEEVTVLGADGAKLYQISLNSFISDRVRELGTDPSISDKLLASDYNRGRVESRMINGSEVLVPNGSRVFNQLKTGESKGISLKTFVKLYEDETKDRGRDYFGISPAEDYVMKMSAMSKDYMVLPTMAGKKTYMFMNGLKLVHENISYSRDVVDNGDGTHSNIININFGNEAKSQIGEYFIAELNSIKSAWKDYQSANGDESKLLDTYHYKGKNPETGERWAGNHGNGLRFRHFGDVKPSIILDGEEKSWNKGLNSYLDNAVKVDPENGLTKALDLLEKTFVTNKESDSVESASSARDNLMNSALTEGLYKELEYASKIGVIEYDGKNIHTLENKLLDRGEFNKNYREASRSIFKGKYNNYEDQAAVIQMIGEGMVNGIISVNEFEKIISKDPAFYSDPDTKIKRLSSILSTGTNLRTDWPIGHRLHGLEEFTSTELKDNLVESQQFNELKSKFLSNSINENLKSSGKETIYNLEDLIRNEYSTGEKNEESSLELKKLQKLNEGEFAAGLKEVKNSFEGYGKNRINQTDATVIVSPAFYRNIVQMLGEWSPKMQNAFDMLESDDSSWMSDPKKYNEVLSMALKPLKMIYFGDKLNPDFNVNVPKLDKMAMFCLFKTLAGGDLAPLYERMNSVDPTLSKIDMVAFDSAVKVGHENSMSYYSDDKSSINDLSQMQTTSQQYKYLRRQLITDPHESSELNLGTQANKVALSNIDPSRTYSNIDFKDSRGASGKDILDASRRANIALSNKGFASLTHELGISFNKELGVDTADDGKLYNLLSKDADESGMSSDIVEKLARTSADKKRYPLQALLDWKWIESRIMSNVGKRVIDVETPGGMFIQMTPFGLDRSATKLKASDFTQEKFEEKTNGKYLINDGKKLNFLNKDGSMDCVVSINLYKDIIPTELQDFTSQKQWLIDNDIIGEKSGPSSIGYRVPTQGLSSMSSLRIADVLPSNIGDTIVLPDEFTKLTGSDFDIDKLFLARYNYKLDENGKMSKVKFDDNIKGEFGEDVYNLNSKEAVQNRLLDTFHAVLTDPNNIQETRQPLDTVTDELKGSILKDIENLSPSEKDSYAFKYLTPAFQSQKKEEFITSKSGIAPYALNNSNHVLTQQGELEFISRGPIKKFGMQSLHNIVGNDGLRILDWESALINAHVDAEKDPYIVRLNVNPYTHNMVNLLLRTGIGKNTFYFTSQPILKDIADSIRMNSSQYGRPKNVSDSEMQSLLSKLTYAKYKNRAMDAIRVEGDPDGVKKRLMDGLEKYDDAKHKILSNDHVLSLPYLREQLGSDRNSFKYLYNQLLVADTFNELTPFAKSLAELVKYSQVDNKKWNNSITSINLFAKNVESIKSLGNKGVFRNATSYFGSTFLDSKLRNAVDAANTLGRGRFFRTTQSVADFIDRAAGLTSSRNITPEETILKIANSSDTMLKSDFWLNYAKENNTDVKDIFFGQNSVAKQLYRLKQKISNNEDGYGVMENNTLFKNINPEISKIDELNQRPDHIYVTSSIKDDATSTEVKEYWGELLESPLPDVKKFATDFMLYQFFSNGENGAFNQVKASEDVREELGYGDYISKRLSDLSNSPVAFENEEKSMRELFVNNWFDDKIVPQVRTHYKDGDNFVSMPTIPSRQEFAKGLTHDAIFIHENARAVSLDLEDNPIFNPYLKVPYTDRANNSTTILYRQIGIVRNGETVEPVYIAVDKKSEKVSGRSILEYGLDKSIIPSNNLSELGKVDENHTYTNEEFKALTRKLVKEYNSDSKFQAARVPNNSYEPFDTFEPISKDSILNNKAVHNVQPDDTTVVLHDKISEYNELAKKIDNHEDVAETMYEDLYNQGYTEEQVNSAMYKYALTILKDDESSQASKDYAKLITYELEKNGVSKDYFDGVVSESNDNRTPSEDNSLDNIVSDTINNEPELDNMQMSGITPTDTADIKTGDSDVVNSTELQKNETNREYTPDEIESSHLQKVFKQSQKGLSIDDIGEELASFFEDANNEPNKKFYVPRIDSADESYSVEDVRSEIKHINDINSGKSGNYIPDNLILPKEYEFRNETNKENINTDINSNTDVRSSDSDKSRSEFGKLSEDEISSLNDKFIKMGLDKITSDELARMTDEEIENFKNCN